MIRRSLVKYLLTAAVVVAPQMAYAGMSGDPCLRDPSLPECQVPTNPCDVQPGEALPAGCSEQLPFLVNDEMLLTPMDGTTNEYEITFQEASTFDNSENKVFYPLDVGRNNDYTEPPEQECDMSIDDDCEANRHRGMFFNFFTNMFDYCFSKTIGFGRDFFGHPDIADTQYGEASAEAQDRRMRYMANIMAGIDQDHKMASTQMSSDATYVDAGIRLNDPVSLLHYDEANKGDIRNQCKFLFREFNPDGVMCRCMGGFGMDAWMPFFDIAQIDTMESSTITVDTEASLLALASQKDGTPYLQTGDDTGDDDEKRLYILKNMLKPMTTMMDLCKRFMFGNDTKDIMAEPKEIAYTFDPDNAVNLVFAVTNDGTTVDSFVGAKMLELRSIYADHINSCEVKYLWKTVGTFHEDEPIKRSYKKHWWSKRTTVDWIYGPEGKMTNTDWVTWCQKGMDKKGMFDYLTDWSKLGFMNPLNWMRGFFAMFDYQITNFHSTVHRSLVLHVKTEN